MGLRLGHVLFLIGFGFALVWMRLFQLMVIDGDSYAHSGRRLQAHSLAATRGTIYTSDGVVLAEDRPGWDIVIRFAQWTPQANGHLLTLLRINGIAIDDEALQAAMTRARKKLKTDIRRELRLSHRDELSPFQKQLLEDRAYPLLADVPEGVWQTMLARPNQFPGLEVSMKPRRTYPLDRSASHVIGYVSRFSAEDRARKDANDDPRYPYLLDMLRKRSWMEIATDKQLQGRVFFPEDGLGRTGLERQYETSLRGWRGVRVIAKEISQGRRIDRLIEEVKPSAGYNLYSTIDSRWQTLCEQSLAHNTGPRGGGIVMMDADTGAVRAMASWPSPVAGRIVQEDLDDRHGRPLINKCVQDQFPLASVFKVVTAIAALEEKVFLPGSLCVCSPEGIKAPGTPRQRCWIANQYKTGHGALKVDEALARSCNIWFFNAGIKLGHKRLSRWSQMFGFGKRTHIDLPGEATGHLPPRKQPEITNFAIGSGNFSGTILQAARLMALVASEGRPVAPHLIERGRPVTPPKMGVSASTWRVVRRGLQGAVNEGTARHPILQRLNVHGKTGTAQLGGQRASHLWFAGYLNLHGRRIAFAICLLEAGNLDIKAPSVMARLLDQIAALPS